MARVFKVGKEYEAYQREFGSITVLRRTDKTIWVTNGSTHWSMRIKKTDDGSEYAVDSTVPRRWRDAFTYDA
jgi:hypothetical protein